MISEKLYFKTGIQSISNQINGVGTLKCKIEVHSAASAYSCIAGDPKSSDIFSDGLCYLI
jgi:hypothetical protein